VRGAHSVRVAVLTAVSRSGAGRGVGDVDACSPTIKSDGEVSGRREVRRRLYLLQDERYSDRQVRRYGSPLRVRREGRADGLVVRVEHLEADAAKFCEHWLLVRVDDVLVHDDATVLAAVDDASIMPAPMKPSSWGGTKKACMCRRPQSPRLHRGPRQRRRRRCRPVLRSSHRLLPRPRCARLARDDRQRARLSAFQSVASCLSPAPDQAHLHEALPAPHQRQSQNDSSASC
jgi:hypothetical protein